MDLVRFCIDCGARLRNQDAADILRYFNYMIKNERVVIIRDFGVIMAFCTFIFANQFREVEALYHRKMWELPDVSRLGKIVYIDKIVSEQWNVYLRKRLQDVLVLRFPQIEWAMWYRPSRGEAPDRAVIRPIQEVGYAAV